MFGAPSRWEWPEMLEPGSQIGRHEIQRRLGRGGMGAVYVAHDPVLGRMVAIKVFTAEFDLPDATERFAREARSAAALAHPHVVTIHDFGEYDGCPFIVMEYVPGETMAHLVRRKASVSITDKLRWLEELCDGLAYAHAKSLLHRDIKPANLMIDRTGRLKILDFGIARLMGTAARTSVVFGTPGYMAPEHIRGEEIDQRVDLFSAGAVAYELLAYREAFPGDTIATITHRVLSEEPLSIDALVPEIGADAAAVIARALAKQPADRFENAAALKAAFAQLRRQHEADERWTAASVPSMPVAGRTVVVTPRSVTPAPSATPWPAVTPASGDVPAPLTPRPSAPAGSGPTPTTGARIEREDLLRRRNLQVNAALGLAHTRFAAEDLEGAIDACQQALLLDETHPGALAIEQQIQEALLARESRQASSAKHDGPVARADAPGRAPASRRRTWAPWTAGAALVVVAAGTAVWFMFMSPAAPPAPSGSLAALVLEAVPWATVVSVQSADGVVHPVPEPAATPLSLRVPPGAYQVVLTGPPSDPASKQIAVDVAAGSVTRAPVVHFQTITPEQYFAPYLTSSRSGPAGAPPAR